MAITIQKGETLTSIANKYGTTVKELAKTNNIANPDLIYAGHTLMLPGDVPAHDHPLGATNVNPAPNSSRNLMPAGSTTLTSPSQIPNYNITGQVGKSGAPGSYLYGTPRELPAPAPAGAPAAPIVPAAPTTPTTDAPTQPNDQTLNYNKVLEAMYKASQADYKSYDEKAAAIRKARYEVGSAPLTENQRLLDPGALARSQEQQRAGYTDQLQAIETLVNSDKQSNATKITGLRDLLSAMKPTEVGGNLVNPLTGEITYQGTPEKKHSTDLIAWNDYKDNGGKLGFNEWTDFKDAQKEKLAKAGKTTINLGAQGDITKLSTDTSNIFSLVNTLLNSDTSKITGLVGYNRPPILPGSDAQYTENQYNELKGTLSLENRSKLKGQGSVSDFEGKILDKAASALNKNLSNIAFRKELTKIKGVFTTANGFPASVSISDPKTKQTKQGMADRNAINQALKDGYIVDYN